MKRIHLLLILLLAICCGAVAHRYFKDNISLSPPKTKFMFPFDKNDKYPKEWAKVDSLEKAGLPKSALEVVENIYSSAKKDNNHDQIIKAFIFRLKYKNIIEENAFERLLQELKTELQNTPPPHNAMMHTMLAEMYWWYYENNRWKFSQRTNTTDKLSDDIKTWTLDQLVSQVIFHYRKSLENSQKAQETKLSVYEETIWKGSLPQSLTPTLYDFLAMRAVNFFDNSEVSLTKPADYFELKEDFYFADAEKFAKTSIQSKDTLSLHFHGIKVLQEWLNFRLTNTSQPEALINADFQRLHFVYSFSVHTEKDSLYLAALQNLEKKNLSVPYSSYISFQIARFYFDQSTKYDAFNKETEKYKDYRKKAFEICKNIIANSKDSIAIHYAKNCLPSITTRNLEFQGENAVIPNAKFQMRISYRNVEKIYFQISSISKEKYLNLAEKHYGNALVSELKKIAIPVYTENYDVPKDADFNYHSIKILGKPLQNGYYLVLMADNKEFSGDKNLVSYDFLNVTNLSYTQRSLSNGDIEGQVFHRQTGETLSDVKILAFMEEYSYITRKYVRKEVGKYTSDKNGMFKVSATSNYRTLFFELYKEKDVFYGSSHYLYKQTENREKEYKTTFFTDRGIYRPGQTVYFKGLVLKTGNDSSEIVKNYKQTVLLYDANWQEQGKVEVTSNEFGTFAGNFVLPTGLLNGQFCVYTATGSKHFSVEEYKRPTFEVSMLPFKENYLLNNVVKVKGKAQMYSGAMLTDAKVQFRITRAPIWCGWRYYSFAPRVVEMKNGTVQTNSQGEFEVEFLAIPDLTFAKNKDMAFRYEIKIDVTDLNGETQSTSKAITVGYRALSLGIQLSAECEKDSISKVNLITQNLNGEFLASEGEIKFFKLKSPSNLPLKSQIFQRTDKNLFTKEEWYKEFAGNEFDNESKFENWNQETEVFSKKFNTNSEKQLDLTAAKTWETGVYCAVLTAKDAFGNDVENRKFFVLFSRNEKTLPYPSINFAIQLTDECEPTEKAKFLIGSAENVQIIYEIEHQRKVVSREILKLNNEQRLIEIPIAEKHRGNLSVHFTFVRDNRFYKNDYTVFVPYTNKELDIEFSTFRDKLLPGEKEKWNIKIKGKKGEKAFAEFLASMYDASLDAFVRNSWNIDEFFARYYASLDWETSVFGTGTSTNLRENVDEYYSCPSFYLPTFNWFGFSYYSGRYYYATESPRMLKSRKKNGGRDDEKSKAVREEDAEMDEVVVTALDVAKEKASDNVPPPPPPPPSFGEKPEIDGKKEKSDEVKVRTNFNETAFFYPQLRTDKEGNVVVEFTIPEALTKWKMMGYAHSQDLKSGYIEKTLVTQKDLMVMPNAPRFFRENDFMEFPVKISNISTKDLKGKVSLEFSDAITTKIISNIFQNETTEKDFEVKAGQNCVVVWKIKIPEGVGAIDYKVVAKADNFSDGEQKTIPVMINRMLVTESMPLPIRSKQTKTFDFKKLSENNSTTLRHHKLTLEFTSNPAWYAVQALPYVMEYPYECAEQTFSRVYANSLATHIANSTPKIAKVFDSWKNLPDSKSLLSNLEKNQELKTALLQETPWVLDAQNESERKRNIGLLFDLNKMGKEMNSAIIKLDKLQCSNGGFMWFDGMPDDKYITQHIVNGFGHLKKLGIKTLFDNSRVEKMVRKAIEYLDERIVDEYRELKDYCTRYKVSLDDNHLSYSAILYLYGRSFYKEIRLPSATDEVSKYYLAQMEKYWLTQSQYMQGLISLTLFRNDKQVTAKKVLASLKEKSILSEELGMYWKENEGGFYWYQAPIETQALMVEAFNEVSNDQESVENLKVWLLKNKQTTNWKTTKATVEAVYALLLKGLDLLANDELVKIKVGNQEIDPRKMDGVQVEAGTGYFKTSWSGTEIKPEMGKVTVSKATEGVAWGAIYWQYFEQLDKITPHSTPLKLTKKLYKETMTDRGPVLEALSNGAILKVGDKVKVRIELSVDRDMEYVHLKDMRASSFEPMNVISGYRYQDGLGYYESTKDASTNFFIGYLRKGTYVFEYPLRVTHKGDFSNGITSIQCMYAPEFGSHSEGIRVKVE